ncbi:MULTISPECIES: hypothetical protein [Kitasatospora]|uniref:hypothetical protein n=1 Tax=Kitasatospora TaxID=2063 RepID=UPI0031DBF941
MSLRASVLPRSTRLPGPSRTAEQPPAPTRLPGRAAVAADRAVRAHLALATVAACALGQALPEAAAALRHCHPVPWVKPPPLGMTQQLLAACVPRLLRGRRRRARAPHGPGGRDGHRRVRRLHPPNGRHGFRDPGRRRRSRRPQATHPPVTCPDVPTPSPRPDFTRP